MLDRILYWPYVIETPSPGLQLVSSITHSVVSLDEQKFFILMKSILSICSFMISGFYVLFKKSLLI